MHHPVTANLEILPGQVNGHFRFTDLFYRDGPVEIEVGIGKGRFVLQQAVDRPEVDFLALEWSLKHLRAAKDRALRRQLSNIRFYRADARHVVAELLPESSVARVHVYCPDPWPKKRHHKRRFFTPDTAGHIERILEPGGFLNVSTDVFEYFERARHILTDHTNLVAAEDPLFPLETAAGKTNYEVKYLAHGRIINRASYMRPPVGADVKRS
jgi:tRNA (guanine-N7-)-methyltransferase